MKKYKVAETMATPGIVVLDAAAGAAGIGKASTTASANSVGVTVDTTTYSTAPAAGAEGVVTVIVNPNAVWRLHMSGAATAGTALLIMTEATGGSKTANTITTGDVAPNSPNMDEGQIVCISGANAGQIRKVTSTSATVATVTVGWYNNNAIGDIFMLLPYTPADVAGNNIQLTTNLDEADASIVVGTGAAFRIVDLEIDFGNVTAARNNSYVHATLDDHIFNVTT